MVLTNFRFFAQRRCCRKRPRCRRSVHSVPTTEMPRTLAGHRIRAHTKAWPGSSKVRSAGWGDHAAAPALSDVVSPCLSDSFFQSCQTGLMLRCHGSNRIVVQRPCCRRRPRCGRSVRSVPTLGTPRALTYPRVHARIQAWRGFSRVRSSEHDLHIAMTLLRESGTG